MKCSLCNGVVEAEKFSEHLSDYHAEERCDSCGARVQLDSSNTYGAFPLHGTARYGTVRFTFGGFSTGYCTWYLILF